MRGGAGMQTKETGDARAKECEITATHETICEFITAYGGIVRCVLRCDAPQVWLHALWRAPNDLLRLCSRALREASFAHQAHQLGLYKT